MSSKARILIAGPAGEPRDALVRLLRENSYDAPTVDSAAAVLESVAQSPADVLVVDLKTPGFASADLFRRLGAREGRSVIIVVAEADAKSAAQSAVREGAFDYLLKPYDNDERIVAVLARAVDWRRQLGRNSNPLEKKSVVSTGNIEIDNKMGGGIPVGSLTLIDGGSHSGKSVLSQQMMWGSVQDGFRLAFFTTENTVKSLVKQMQSLNIDVLDFMVLRRLRVYPMEVVGGKGSDLEHLLTSIRDQRARGSDIVLVDALTPFILTTPATEVIGYFEGCKRVCSEGCTLINVIHSHAVNSELLVRITSLCDAHLSLRTEQVGAKLVKVMEVAKVRGASKNTGNIVSFEVEPGLGMRIIPISKAQG
jgi:archaeal flagellar protein FlaH